MMWIKTKLKAGLDDVVMSCVNSVGVEVNTASKELLSYVSGLGVQLAKNIVEYRNQHGAFKTRNELMKVARLATKPLSSAQVSLSCGYGFKKPVGPQRFTPSVTNWLRSLRRI